MLSANQIYISEAAIDSLNTAATELQARLTDYSPEELHRALLQWFETSIESIAEDALFHTLEGRADLAIGRTNFNQSLAKSHLTHAPNPISRSHSHLTAQSA